MSQRSNNSLIKRAVVNQAELAVVAFLFSQVLLGVVLHFAHHDFFRPDTWSRWDSGIYISIATTGYEMYPCAGRDGNPETSTGVCGNAGWFPGYPLLIRLLGVGFKNKVMVAVVISKSLYLLSLFLILKIAGVKQFSLRNILFISMAAVSFSFVYFNAVFPLSAEVFFILSGFYFYLRRKPWITGLFCFLASFFYPSGFVLAFVFAIAILLNKEERFKNKIKPILIQLVMGGLGVFLAFLIIKLSVNDWTAFLKVQAKYGHQFINPVSNVVLYIKHLPYSSFFSIKNVSIYQSLLVLAGYILMTVLFFVQRMYRDELWLLTFIFLSLFLVFPWSLGGPVSTYRSEALLLPFVFLVKGARASYLSVILVILLLVGLPLSFLFFDWTLV
jgi:hypothetical protein